MIDDDTMQGTRGRRWRPTPGLSEHAIRRRPDAGSWLPEGTVHAVDGQLREAICGAPCPYKWDEWPPVSGEICPDCLALAIQHRGTSPSS